MTGILDLQARETTALARDLLLTGPPEETLPRVQLLDAAMSSSPGADGRRLGADDLRSLARRLSERRGAGHSSRSYCFPRALVASHDAPVGVDIERVGRCDDAFACSIQTPAERAGASLPDDRDWYLTSLWSSKEALAKALGEPLAYDPRRLQGPGAWPHGRSGPWRASALDVGAGHVAWVCWRAV
jgi:hypothetical protein